MRTARLRACSERTRQNRKVISLELDSAPWSSLDDTVMGGVSSSRMIETAEGLRFEGVVSLDNNGGFASVRRELKAEWVPFRAIHVQLRGDGKRYQVRVRENEDSSAVAWRYIFQATEAWRHLEIPLDEFEPVFRGRRLEINTPVNSQNIHLLGFMTAEKLAGPFGMEIAKIELV